MSRQQLQTIVQMLRSQPVVKPDATVQEARAGFEQIASMFPVDADIKREAVDAGSVKAEWLSAPDADMPACHRSGTGDDVEIAFFAVDVGMRARASCSSYTYSLDVVMS